jgi:hypothetical protein
MTGGETPLAAMATAPTRHMCAVAARPPTTAFAASPDIAVEEAVASTACWPFAGVAACAATAVVAAALDGGEMLAGVVSRVAAGSAPAGAFIHGNGCGGAAGAFLGASGEAVRAVMRAAPTRHTRAVSLLDRTGAEVGCGAAVGCGTDATAAALFIAAGAMAGLEAAAADDDDWAA